MMVLSCFYMTPVVEFAKATLLVDANQVFSNEEDIFVRILTMSAYAGVHDNDIDKMETMLRIPNRYFVVNGMDYAIKIAVIDYKV